MKIVRLALIWLFTLFSNLALAQEKPQETTTPVAPVAATPALPASCAPFAGGEWVGDWEFGSRTLKVAALDANCSGYYSYGTTGKNNTFKWIQIKQGTLEFTCGSSGGTCSFSAHGDELWGRYGGRDGFNNAVFKKVATPGQSK